MIGSLVLDVLYSPLPNHDWSELIQFALQAETEAILGQLALLGIGIFMLLQSWSKVLLHTIAAR